MPGSKLNPPGAGVGPGESIVMGMGGFEMGSRFDQHIELFTNGVMDGTPSPALIYITSAL